MRNTVDSLKEKTYQYRKRFLEIFTGIGFGHVTSAFSWAEIAAVLYNEVMDIPAEVKSVSGHDKMVVSKGHGAGMLFPVFEDMGYFTKEEMERIVKIGGGYNCDLKELFYPGFDFYGGSLGMGLGVAAGLAKAAKLSGFSWRTFCVIGDAECCEGSIWEAAAFAGHNRLDNLVAIVDRNMLGCSDFTEHMLALEPLADKWRSFGFEAVEIDGHDIQAVYDALKTARDCSCGKPKCIIAHTKKGQGLNYLIDKPLMHGYMPKGGEAEEAFRQLK